MFAMLKTKGYGLIMIKSITYSGITLFNKFFNVPLIINIFIVDSRKVALGRRAERNSTKASMQIA